MSLVASDAAAKRIEEVVIQGDLKSLSASERVMYYRKVCDSAGLNPLTKPFEYIVLNGKLTLYALRAATDQLRSVKNVSITIPSREVLGDVYVVTARAKIGDREDESTGAVAIAGLRGDALANAYLKAETKAKRRVTLSICGLGLLDESEVESIPQPTKSVAAPVVTMDKKTAERTVRSVCVEVMNAAAELLGRRDGVEEMISDFTTEMFSTAKIGDLTLEQMEKLLVRIQEEQGRAGGNEGA